MPLEVTIRPTHPLMAHHQCLSLGAARHRFVEIFPNSITDQWYGTGAMHIALGQFVHISFLCIPRLLAGEDYSITDRAATACQRRSARFTESLPGLSMGCEPPGLRAPPPPG